MNNSVCRVCLAGSTGEVRLQGVNNQLLDVYKKLTNAKVTADNANLCYICEAQLRKCYRFAEMARRSEQYLKTVLETDSKVQDETLKNMLNIIKLQTLSVTTLKPIYLDGLVRKKPKKPQEAEKLAINESTAINIANLVPNEKVKLLRNETVITKLENIDTTEKLYKFEIMLEDKEKQLIKNETLVVLDNTDLILGVTDEETVKCKNEMTIKGYATKKTITEDKQIKEVIQKVTEVNQNNIHKNLSQINNETKCKNEINILKSYATKKVITEEGRIKEEIKEDIEKITEVNQNITDEIHENVTQVKDYVVINDTELYYECDICHDIFPKREELATHQTKHKSHKKPTYNIEEILKNLPDTEKPYCPICKKFLAGYTSQLMEHMKIHTGERPFICDTCGKSSRTKHHLLEHIRTHTKEKVHCKICEKSFTQMSSLGKHMITHTKKDPHFCHLCGKTFTQSGQLRMHIRSIHEGIKPHCCEICAKRFSGKTEWRRHMDSHATIKSFTCDRCGSRLTTKASLNRHKKHYCKMVEL